MKIVHIITRFLNAGAEENTLFSCNGQVRLGHEVHLIYGNEVAEQKQQELDPEVHQHQVPSLIREISPLMDSKATKETRRLLQVIQPDIVHTHTSKAGVIGRIAAKRANVPCIIHGVHMLAFEQVSALKRALYLTAEKAVTPCTDAFINVSPGTKAVCLQHGLGKEEQHYVVPSGMDIAKFQNAKVDDWRKLINPEQIATKHPQFIAFVGSYEPRKRHLELLPLFAEIVKACPDAVLLFLGEGENEAKIRAKITELHLEQHVLMLGFQPNVEAYLAISQLGILPSAREGLARVVIQYVLAGLPVVCTNTPGVNLIAKDGENALIAPVDDITPMQQQIITVLQDEALRKRMSNASRAQDLSQWGIDHMVNSIETIYQKYAKV